MTVEQPKPLRLWGGRFTGKMDPLMNEYNESLTVDRVFYAVDLKGSIAYARANVKTGILTEAEFKKIEGGLKAIHKEWEEGKFVPVEGDEGKLAQLHLTISGFHVLAFLETPPMTF
jgi:argininosuccinate lyase